MIYKDLFILWRNKMSTKKFQISARVVAERMDNVTQMVIDGKVNVNVGSLALNEFRAVMSAYKLQLEQSKITGKPMENPLVNMD